MEKAYKGFINLAIANQEAYKKHAVALVVEFISLGSSGPKILCNTVNSILKDSKENINSKLLSLLILDDATCNQPMDLLAAVSNHKNLVAYFEQAAKQGDTGGPSGMPSARKKFSTLRAKQETIPPPMVNTIISFMWKWSHYLIEQSSSVNDCPAVRGWRSKFFAQGMLKGYKDKYMVYRAPGTLIDGATLIIGGLVEEGSWSEAGGETNASKPVAKPDNSKVKKEITEAMSRILEETSAEAKKEGDSRASESSIKYTDEDYDRICFELLTEPGNPAKKEEASLILSYLQKKLTEAADNERFDDYDGYIDKFHQINQALEDCVMQQKQMEFLGAVGANVLRTMPSNVGPSAGSTKRESKTDKDSKKKRKSDRDSVVNGKETKDPHKKRKSTDKGKDSSPKDKDKEGAGGYTDPIDFTQFPEESSGAQFATEFANQQPKNFGALGGLEPLSLEPGALLPLDQDAFAQRQRMTQGLAQNQDKSDSRGTSQPFSQQNNMGGPPTLMYESTGGGKQEEYLIDNLIEGKQGNLDLDDNLFDVNATITPQIQRSSMIAQRLSGMTGLPDKGPYAGGLSGGRGGLDDGRFLRVPGQQTGYNTERRMGRNLTEEKTHDSRMLPEDVYERINDQLEFLQELTEKQNNLFKLIGKNEQFQNYEFSQAIMSRQKAEVQSRDLNQRHNLALAQYKSAETRVNEQEQGISFLKSENARLTKERDEYKSALEKLRANYERIEKRFENQEEVLYHARDRILEHQNQLADCMGELDQRKEIQKNLQQRLFDARTGQRDADNQLSHMRDIFDATEARQVGDQIDFAPVKEWDAYARDARVHPSDELALTTPFGLARPSGDRIGGGTLAEQTPEAPPFEFPFHRLSGPPIDDPTERQRLETLYRNMCHARKGLLYADASVELYMSIEVNAPIISCTIVVRNVSIASVGDVEIVACPTNPDGPPPLEVRPQGMRTIPKSGEIQFLCRLTANQPYMGFPSFDLKYLCLDNCEIKTRMRVPLTCTRLINPLELRTQMFFEYWKDPDMECQSSFRAPVRNVFFEAGGFFLLIKSLELSSFKMLPGVAATNETVVMTGIYPRKARRSEVLVRADLSVTDRSIIVYVRSSSYLISAAVCRTLSDVLCTSAEERRNRNRIPLAMGGQRNPMKLPSAENAKEGQQQQKNTPWFPRDPRQDVDTWIHAENNLDADPKTKSGTFAWNVGNSCRSLRPSMIPHRKINMAI